MKSAQEKPTPTSAYTVRAFHALTLFSSTLSRHQE